MSTTTRQAGLRADAGWRTSDGSSVQHLPSRRRSPIHLALGALLVVVCTLGFALAASRLDHRSPMLVLARPVKVGQILTAADLRSVPMSTGSGVDSIPVSGSGSVIGQQMAVSLPAGALLTRAELGTTTIPGTGEAMTAVAVKPGQYPPDLAPGARVHLISVGSNDQQAIAPTTVPADGWAGIVTDVQPLASGEGSVVTVLLGQADALRVAALPASQVGVVVVAGG